MPRKIYALPWWVYIVECADKTLYVGITRDLKRRVHEHNNTKRCRYTRTRRPVKLVYKERKPNYGAAIKREIEIKGFTRKKKLELIDTCFLKGVGFETSVKFRSPKNRRKDT